MQGAAPTIFRWISLLRPLPLLLALAWLALSGREFVSSAAAEPDSSRALARWLEGRGLETDPSEVFWLDEPAAGLASRFAEPRAVLRARQRGEPADIHLATVKLSPEGRLLAVTGLYNLSDTSAVDERKLVVGEQRAAWTIAGAGKTYSVHVAELDGAPLPDGARWTRLQKAQHSITNLQQSGSGAGVGRRSFKLDPAASKVSLAFSDHALVISADGRRIRIPNDRSAAIDGARFVQEQEHHLSRPGNLVTWAVDRVRALPWFGSDRMQAVKAVAFTGLDWVQRAMGSVTGDDGSDAVAEELGALVSAPLAEFRDPETGWPPPPMEPMLSPPLEGEGKWRSLESDPFVRSNPGAPAPFVTSFIRTDRKRAYSQIFVLVWDPRQVALHTMSGTVEPKSATGETGPGRVPRDPQVMGRLLAGFNGGFQATHGEFGMMADRVVYLPPKPYAATVAELEDGSTGFGTWPREETVPAHIVSFRQNMTPLVMDDTINPYKRNWWGGVPPGWTDEARTVRSGLCMTKEKFVVYFYGSSIDADHLALAMQRARCSYGLHLDMNPGHTGLEFYRAAPEGELPDVGHKLDPQWEAEGSVSDMPGWRFIGRRMLRYMGLMNFPRYIQRESRDFFYLTLRPVLPGAPLKSAVEPSEPTEGVWKVNGLPQHGWPYVVATTWLRPDASRRETKVRVLALDPRALHGTSADAPGDVVVSVRKPEAARGKALWLSASQFVVADDAPSKDALRLANAVAPGVAPTAAAGIDADGMLLVALVATSPEPARDGAMLSALLAKRGCTQTILLSEFDVALGGDRDLSGHPVPQRPGALILARKAAPGASRIFDETPVVAPKEWYPLQAKRVRYFRAPKPAESEGGSGDSSGAGTQE